MQRCCAKNWLLNAKTIQSAALEFQCIGNIHGINCLPFGVFHVGDCIANNIFKKHSDGSTGPFHDMLDTSAATQSMDVELNVAF